MTSIRKIIVAGACALGVGLGAMPAEAASPSADASSKTIAGIRYDQIQKVDRRGWSHGGGRRYGGGWGGGRHYGGGWGGGRRYYGGGYGGRRYGGYYGGYRHRGYGGYAAAGVLGLATGALIASSYDRPYYRDGYYRRSYSYGGECQVISRSRDYYGRPVRVVRYRPC